MGGGYGGYGGVAVAPVASVGVATPAAGYGYGTPVVAAPVVGYGYGKMGGGKMGSGGKMGGGYGGYAVTPVATVPVATAGYEVVTDVVTDVVVHEHGGGHSDDDGQGGHSDDDHGGYDGHSHTTRDDDGRPENECCEYSQVCEGASDDCEYVCIHYC